MNVSANKNMQAKPACAPKAGGGCGLLINSTTTSPMAQPQCGNVNIQRKTITTAQAILAQVATCPQVVNGVELVLSHFCCEMVLSLS